MLASGSPRRRELLSKYNLEPIIVIPQVEEEKISSEERVDQITMVFLPLKKQNR